MEKVGEVLGERLFAGLTLKTHQVAGGDWMICMAFPTSVGTAAGQAGRARIRGARLSVFSASISQPFLYPRAHSSFWKLA